MILLSGMQWTMAFHFRQNSMFHFTLYFAQSIQSILHFVTTCCYPQARCHKKLNRECEHSRFNFFALNVQLWFTQHSSFRFRHSTFPQKQQSSFRIRPSSSVECTFIFLHPTFSICPLSFRFGHSTLGIVLASFRIRHWTFTRWSASDGDRGLNWHDPPPLKLWSRVDRETSSGVDSGDLLRSRQTRFTTVWQRWPPIAKMLLHNLLVSARWEPLS